MVVAIQGIPYCWKPREKQSARWSRTATQHLHRKIGIKGDGDAREAVEISESSWSHIRPSIMLACHGPLRLLYQINHSKYLPTRDRRKIRMRLVISCTRFPRSPPSFVYVYVIGGNEKKISSKSCEKGFEILFFLVTS